MRGESETPTYKPCPDKNWRAHVVGGCNSEESRSGSLGTVVTAVPSRLMTVTGAVIEGSSVTTVMSSLIGIEFFYAEEGENARSPTSYGG